MYNKTIVNNLVDMLREKQRTIDQLRLQPTATTFAPTEVMN